jgi:hypothetical protein
LDRSEIGLISNLSSQRAARNIMDSAPVDVVLLGVLSFGAGVAVTTLTAPVGSSGAVFPLPIHRHHVIRRWNEDCRAIAEQSAARCRCAFPH